jgi:hypothetical protein
MCLFVLSIYSDDLSEDDNSELEALQKALGRGVPIYASPGSVHELLEIISEDVPASKICVKKPCGVQTFSSFVVDLNKERFSCR